MELLLSDASPKPMVSASTVHHTGITPSAWIERWSQLVGPGARVLDVACGSGRHVRWFAERGAVVTGVDRDADALVALQPLGRMIVADIEGGPWPLAGESFDAVVVTNYLYRKLFPILLQCLAQGGVLLYETFGKQQALYGKPSNPAFLLEPLELIKLCEGLHVLAYEDLVLESPRRHVQRIAARRERAP